MTPTAGLTNVGGILYGTIDAGGTCGSGLGNFGTVFAVTTSGSERPLHCFDGGMDGAYAYAGLTYANGALYGATYEGGGSGCSTSESTGCGTVFMVTTSGSEAVLYRFQGGADGARPFSAPVYVNGAFYGTTAYGGGAGGYCNYTQIGGCGTVFKLTMSGDESVLHAFTGPLQGADGAYPFSGLTTVGGALYGTTKGGGAYRSGTIFKV